MNLTLEHENIEFLRQNIRNQTQCPPYQGNWEHINGIHFYNQRILHYIQKKQKDKKRINFCVINMTPNPAKA